jgi:hypothetical protein
MFGGLKDDKPSNELVLYEFSSAITKCKVIRARGDVPRPRYGHASVIINNRLYIHGGQGGHDGKTYFSDMYYYDFQNNIWVEIDALGCMAHPLAYHSIVSVSNQYLLTYGGVSSANGIPTDAIFRFDTRTVLTLLCTNFLQVKTDGLLCVL